MLNQEKRKQFNYFRNDLNFFSKPNTYYTVYYRFVETLKGLLIADRIKIEKVMKSDNAKYGS